MQICAKLYELIRLDLNFGERAGCGRTSLFCVSVNCISQILKVYVSYIVISISLILHFEEGVGGWRRLDLM